jgi:hypothetical protein
VLVLAVLLCPAGVGMAKTWYADTFSEIRSAGLSANYGDEIVIAPGEYHVTSSLYITRPGLTFRGATGNRDDVVLYGNGMNVNSGVKEGFWAAADDIQLRDLTIRDFWHHGIHVCGTSSSTSDGYADNVVISNVKTINCGERHVKGSSSSGISSNILIENLWMEQTEPYLPRPGHPVDSNNYIGGIDAMHLSGWTIRDSTAVNIRGATGGGRAAVFLWNGVTDVTIERNTIVSCGHGISIGNPSGPNNSHEDPWHAVGGVIRNNFIVRRGDTYDWAMELDNVKNFQVYNNTLYSADAGYFRTLQIYDETDEGMTTNLDIRNNIIRGGVHDVSTGDWSSADLVAMGNIVDFTGAVVTPAWFVDPLAGDLHLTAAALAAIDAAVPLAEVFEDIDTGNRPASPDMGADEYQIPWPGDANQDGVVGIADLSALADNYGRVGIPTWTHGDFNRDGEVGIADLALLADHYGDSPGLGGIVPEPAALCLLAAGALAIPARRRHRR